jgi:hypothetical protein
MDLKELFFLANSKNILEQHKLPHTFFTEPHKKLTEDVCLEQIIRILGEKELVIPVNDSSDLYDMVEGKDKFSDSYHYTIQKRVKTPYIKPTPDSFVNLICFMKAYASHTYTHKGSFKEYFKDVFDVFYNI